MTLTTDDLDWAREQRAYLLAPCDADECQIFEDGCRVWPTCDCQSSALIMTSIGYVEVQADGDIVAFGTTIHILED